VGIQDALDEPPDFTFYKDIEAVRGMEPLFLFAGEGNKILVAVLS
jgi:hypothetical protein